MIKAFHQIDNNIFRFKDHPAIPAGIEIGFGIQDMTKDPNAIYRQMIGRYGRAVLLDQEHSDRVAIIDRGNMPIENPAILTGDALITDRKNIAITVHSADCLPLIFFDEGSVTGIVHAGWRGTLQRILQKSLVKAVEKFDMDISKTVFLMMPSIGACCYEVGPEVAVLFSGERGRGRLTIDMARANMIQLAELGVDENQIIFRGTCTCCGSDFDYPSLRKEGKIKRKMISFIARTG